MKQSGEKVGGQQKGAEQSLGMKQERLCGSGPLSVSKYVYEELVKSSRPPGGWEGGSCRLQTQSLVSGTFPLACLGWKQGT